MLISDRKQFIFLHNPKTAGSSIRNSLKKYDDRENYYWDHDDNAALGRIVDKAHIPLSDFAVYKDFQLLDDYFVFGFVRNPYDKVYSAFQERKRQWALPEDMDFNNFVQQELTECNIRYDWNYIHFCPQYYFFYASGKCRADYIGRYESIDRDFVQLANIIQVETGGLLPQINQSGEKTTQANKDRRSPDSLPHFDEASLKIVNRLYDKDFVFFNYDKYFSVSSEPSDYFENSHTESVCKKLMYIKGSESFYAARMEELSDLKASYHQLEESFHQLEKADSHLQISISELKMEYDTSQKQHQLLAEEYNALLNSKSWRLTEPLRWVKKLFYP